MLAAPYRASAAEAEWIWHAEHRQGEVPAGAVCHFRKVIGMKEPEAGQISIIADDAYELFLNGRRVGSSEGSRKLKDYDVARFLVRGNNILAVKITNKQGKTAAFAARVLLKENGEGWTAHSTDGSWRVELSPLPFWNTALYNDRGWERAHSFGKLGETAPFDQLDPAPSAIVALPPPPSVTERLPQSPTQPATARREPTPAVPADSKPKGKPEKPALVLTDAPADEPPPPQPPLASIVDQTGRFKISEEFRVERMLNDQDVGSLICCAFNEFGQLILSREGAGLALAVDGNGDGAIDTVRPWCDKVKNIQGILPLNGDVFVTGEGPEGSGLYRLSDKDRDGELEQVRLLLRFKGDNPEHGAHGLALGPDGLIYAVIGNLASLDGEYEKDSPYRNYYEGDLTPRYEDPGGHAVGVKAPGGVVIRTDPEGRAVQLVAGGLRNAYDLAFNRHGDMFVHDSDMEADEGTTWYRPTRLFQIVPGGEYGWRSGWANWPTYYCDSLPPLLETGRGSPAGSVIYDHFMLPARYHGVLFSADWSQGRIMALKLEPNGASYKANSEVFLEGQPLSVTDIDVGQDGLLYFVTGGRGTAGSVYRVSWRGDVPENVRDLGTGLTAAIRQPQMQSAASRQAITEVRAATGKIWETLLTGVAKSASNPAAYRVQALNLMQLYGSGPSPTLLLALSEAPNEQVRARAAELMALRPEQELKSRLIAMLDDPDRLVRRKTCEALARSGGYAPWEKLVKLLGSDDRFEAYSARRLLERTPTDQWTSKVLTTTENRLLVQGGLAWMIAHPESDGAIALLERIAQVMQGFVSDKDFVDLLRLIEVALHRGEVRPSDVPGLGQQLAEELPSGDPVMNRELARLVAYFRSSSAIGRSLEYLKSDASDVDKLHLAIHLRFLENGWTPAQRLTLLRFYEQAQQRKGGGSYARYILYATRDVAKLLTPEQSWQVLDEGAKMPNAALGALYNLPAELGGEELAKLRQLDLSLSSKEGDAVLRLQVGIVALLARSGEESSLAYLRETWDKHPQRRLAISMGLALHPTGDNWLYLVKSLPILDAASAPPILQRLATIERAPEQPDDYRQLIILGLRLQEKGAAATAAKLLEFWTGENPAEASATTEAKLAAWQKWFQDKFPELPPAQLPPSEENARFKFEELFAYLNGDEAPEGKPAKGAQIFAKAQCVKCHRFGDRGESVGPDLSTVTKRFTKREILESILHPSQVISSQYASKTVLTSDGQQLTGLVVPGAPGETVILQSNGEKRTLKADEVAATKPSKISAMPAGLLNDLTLEEIVDLFAYLYSGPHETVSNRPTK
jgi:putative heme-binding domain-containing protein